MMNEVPSEESRREDFLNELEREIPDSRHRRLIQAYLGDNPVQSMESELAKILLEAMRGED